MILKRLSEILGTFDKVELKRFERFLRSDYFNTNERIYKLFKALKKFYPIFDDPRLTNEHLFKELYGQKKFDDKTFRYLLSELMTLSEKYLSLSNIEEDKQVMEKQLIKRLLAKRLFTQAQSHLKEIDKKLEGNFVISGSDINNRCDYLESWHNLFFFSGKQDPVTDITKKIEGGEYIVFRAIIELSHIYQNLIAVTPNYNIELPEDNLFFTFLRNLDYKAMYVNLDNIENSFKTNKYKYELVIAFKIYVSFMITFLDEKDKAYFYKMKKSVAKYSRLFNREELQNLHIMLVSCCEIKRKIFGEHEYLVSQFEILKSALSLNLYSQYKGQYMEVPLFSKIFETAFALKEYSWAEDFINRYKKELSPEFCDDIYHYSNAELNFKKKQFESAHESLSKIKSLKYFQLKIKVRNLTLMIYYELNYIEQAIALLNTYTHFLINNKRVRAEQKETELNFLSFLKELLKLKETRKDNGILKSLRNDISKCGQLVRKDWLLEKAGELT